MYLSCVCSAVLFVAVFSGVVVTSEVLYAPIIQLTSGKVQGLVRTLHNGSQVHIYEGIRYGNAKRFSKPTPAEPWNDIYNATQWRDACPQRALANVSLYGVALQTSTMSEDCLYLTVCKPVEARANVSRAVMVWVHGGGFESGTIFSLLYDCGPLATRGDVIVVTVAYRVDAFGFLYAPSADTPGNLGLHDLILALQWVQQNIVHFGGDPSRVTLFGQSAGSMCVGALIVSPLARGLFKRAILQSGAPNSYYGSESTERSLGKTIHLMRRMGCNASLMEQNVACLRNKTVSQILNATLTGLYSRHYGFIPIYGDLLLPMRPSLALSTGHVNRDIDLMFGVTKEEGTTFVNEMFVEFRNATLLSKVTLESARWNIVRMMRHYQQPYGFEVARFYTRTLDQNSSVDLLRSAVGRAFADYFFVCPTVLFAEHYARTSPSSKFFAYRLDQTSNVSFGDCNREWMGVCHGYDVMYLFVVPSAQRFPVLFGENDRQLSEHMIEAWTAFAKIGQPSHSRGNGTWQQAFVSLLNQTSLPITNHFSLNVTDYHMVAKHFEEQCHDFWKPKIFV